MLLSFVSAFLFAPADVARAQQAYEQAYYDAALLALGDSCDVPSTVVECERIRAFTHAALGHEREALSAFARMLGADPTARLDNDVSPKLVGLFSVVDQAFVDMGQVSLEYIPSPALQPGAPSSDPGIAGAVGSKLVMSSPKPALPTTITAYLAPEGAPSFTVVPLLREGDLWAANYRIDKASTGTPVQYFLEVVLASGLTLYYGAAPLPRMLNLVDLQAGANITTGGNTAGAHVAHGTGPKAAGNQGAPLNIPPPLPDAPSATSTAAAGMPRWVVWTIVGGVSLLVAGGVTAAVLLSKAEAPGTLLIGVHFNDGGALR